MAETETQGSWYQTGFKARLKEEERIANLVRPNRAWMPKGVKKEYIFLDDDPFTVHEHNYYMDGNWKNWLTCARGVYDDPLCCQKLGVKRRRFTGFFTVVDCSEWKDGNGNTHQYELIYYPALNKGLKLLEDRKESNGSLVGAVMVCQRLEDQSPGGGDDIQFKRMADLKKLFDVVQFRGKKLKDIIAAANRDPKEADFYRKRFQAEPDSEGKFAMELRPFNYMELLKPRSPKEMKELIGSYVAPKADGSQSSGEGGEASEDDVPF